jgi:hypothetical protein
LVIFEADERGNWWCLGWEQEQSGDRRSLAVRFSSEAASSRCSMRVLAYWYQNSTRDCGICHAARTVLSDIADESRRKYLSGFVAAEVLSSIL